MKLRFWNRIAWLLVIAAATGTTAIWAHEGPEHEIEELTDLLKIRGDSADLLLQRAIEYRVLGQMSHALKDLEDATRIDPADIKIQRELSKVQFWTGKTNEALETVSHAIATKANEPDEKAGLLIIRSQFLRARGDYKRAVADALPAETAVEVGAKGEIKAPGDVPVVFVSLVAHEPRGPVVLNLVECVGAEDVLLPLCLVQHGAGVEDG